MTSDSPNLLNADIFRVEVFPKVSQQERTAERSPELTSPYLKVKNIRSTDPVVVRGDYIVHATYKRKENVTAPEQIERRAQPQPAAHVNGTIVAIEEGSVLCELELAEGPQRIRLARGLFPEGIEYAAPIQLRMEEIDGIRRPIVELRDVQRSGEIEAIRARVDRLISEL